MAAIKSEAILIWSKEVKMKNVKAELKRLKVENLDLKLQIKEQASLIEDLASKQCKVWLDMQQEFSKIRKRPI